MISLIRLEAEDQSVGQVVQKLNELVALLRSEMAGMAIHDEHYERVHDHLYKGRIVYKRGSPAPSADALVIGVTG